MTRQELIKRLTDIQNRPCNANIDIMTITGFMDLAELTAHVERYENKGA